MPSLNYIIMKKSFISISFLLLVILGFAISPKEQPTAAAKTAFASRFPAAQYVKWSVEKPGEFEVEFMLGKVKSAALYGADGTLIEIEEEIKASDLPQAVKGSVANDFNGYKLNEIEKVTHPNGDITFEMEAISGKVKLEISFDTKGKLLSKEALKKE